MPTYQLRWIFLCGRFELENAIFSCQSEKAVRFVDVGLRKFYSLVPIYFLSSELANISDRR